MANGPVIAVCLARLGRHCARTKTRFDETTRSVSEWRGASRPYVARTCARMTASTLRARLGMRAGAMFFEACITDWLNAITSHPSEWGRRVSVAVNTPKDCVDLYPLLKSVC